MVNETRPFQFGLRAIFAATAACAAIVWAGTTFPDATLLALALLLALLLAAILLCAMVLGVAGWCILLYGLVEHVVRAVGRRRSRFRSLLVQKRRT